MRFQLVLLGALAVTFATPSAVAASGHSAPEAPTTTPDPWTYYAFPIPIEQGEYYSPTGTLGSFGIGITNDDRHILTGATYFYDQDGRILTQATGGIVTYNDDATIRATGIIASADIATADTTDGPCRGCAPHDRVTTPTTDSLHIDWTGPRTARVTVNGQTEELVNAVSGPPLVAPTDFSGTWMMMWHEEVYYSDVSDPPPPLHYEDVVYVRLTPVGRRHYSVIDSTDPALSSGPAGVTPPPEDAHYYDITCAGTPCDLDSLPFPVQGTPGFNAVTLWLGDDNQGRILASAHHVDGFDVIYDYGLEYPRAYASGDTIVWRRAYLPNAGYPVLTEAKLVRVGPTFNGAWTCAPGHCSAP